MNFLPLFREIGLSGLFDIAFMAVLIYAVLVWFKRAKAAFVLTGMVILGAVYLIAHQFNLQLTVAVFQSFFAVLLIALVVIFQEELRHFFERVAVWSLHPKGNGSRRAAPPGGEAEILAGTLAVLARGRIGALVVLRGKDALARHLDGGVILNGELSGPLLLSIFDPHSEGHDGAVIVENGRVHRFAAHLPLSKDLLKLEHGGTRHAAALGLAERTDALCLVVSEERGTISAARNGELRTLAGEEEPARVIEAFFREIAPAAARSWAGNLKEKAAAVAMASALWFVVVHEAGLVTESVAVRVEEPELRPPWRIAKVEPDEVRLTLSGSRRSFFFFSPSNVRLYLKVIEPAEGTRRVLVESKSLTMPPGVSFESADPPAVEVTIERKP